MATIGCVFYKIQHLGILQDLTNGVLPEKEGHKRPHVEDRLSWLSFFFITGSILLWQFKGVAGTLYPAMDPNHLPFV